MSRTRKSSSWGATRSRKPALRLTERLESRRLLAVAPFPGASQDEADEANASGGCPVCGSSGCVGHTDENGLTYMRCAFPAPAVAPLAVDAVAAVAVAPLADTFLLHSRPTATKKIYLDFDGHVTSGTPWQGGKTFTTPAFSLDSNFTAFSDAEKSYIQSVWSRVAEDFILFDVDVTTEAPSVDDLRNTGGGDTRWGIRVVIGGDGAWMSGAAGVAYVNSFNWGSDTPCFCFGGQWWKTDQEFMSTCISHEVGHTLGLRHDGYNGATYYGGRGSGATSWGPIMGNPSRPLTQWSNGDYGGSTNKQDDLTVMTGFGFGFRPDDHGDTIASATISTSAQFTVTGIIGLRTDVDMFGFTAAAGRVEITVKPLAVGANLDVVARLLDATGAVIATSNPVDALDASFNLTVAAGTYFISVDGTGKGDPATTGYSDYGSLGQYTVTVGEPTDPLPTLSVADVAVTEGNTGTTTATLTVTLSAAASTVVTVDYATADWTATVAGNDYDAATGSLTFAAGETSKTIAVQVRGDTAAEADERFFVRLSGPVGAAVARAEGEVTILDDDGAPPPPPPPPDPDTATLTVTGGSVMEGSRGTTPAAFTFTLSQPLSVPVTIRCRVGAGTATPRTDYFPLTTGQDGTFTVTIPANSQSVSLPVKIVGDILQEATETIVIDVVDFPQDVIDQADASATISIVDDDQIEFTLSGPDRVTEGNAGTRTVAFTVELSRPVKQVTRVQYTVVAGTATPGADFRAATLPTVLVFSPNQRMVRINVGIVGDRVAESDETFRIVLSEPVGAVLGSVAEKTVTIANDDGAGGTVVPRVARLVGPVAVPMAVRAVVRAAVPAPRVDVATLALAAVGQPAAVAPWVAAGVRRLPAFVAERVQPLVAKLGGGKAAAFSSLAAVATGARAPAC